jgi:hypothetical protein
MVAVNPLRGQATLEHAGATKILVFDVNSLCLAENALGVSAFDILGLLNDDDLTMTQARALLWAGLSEHHPCTVTDAGKIISDVGLGAAGLAILSALAAAFGVSAEGKKDSDPPKGSEAGTG